LQHFNPLLVWFYISVVTLHYIVEFTFEKRDFERFGFPSLLAQGLQVRVWDLSPIYDPEGYESHRRNGTVHDYDGYRACFDEGETTKQLARLGPTDAVLAPYGFCYHARAIPRALSRSKAWLGQFRLGTSPAYMMDEAALAEHEVVENGDGVARIQKLGHHDRTDVACAACDENVQTHS
jgi:hypothetical protein